MDKSAHYEHSAKSIAVDCTGTFVVLGTRKGLFVVALDSLWEAYKTINHLSKWEVGTIEWCPHKSHQTYIANTVSNVVQIWDISLDDSPKSQLNKHTRAITDLSWSPHDPLLLATCSADTFIYMWDLRMLDASSTTAASGSVSTSPGSRTARPVKAFCAWTAGSSHVKWNRHDPNAIASAHDGEVRIWDIRKESSHNTFITAHVGKILSLDWSWKSANELVTCGQDKQVKIWNIQSPKDPKTMIPPGYPVSLAKYTPFGEGLITINQRIDFQIRLWSLLQPNSSVRLFSGHTDTIRAFDFRVRPNNDFQLVSWSQDKTLRLWSFDAQDLDACGFSGSSTASSSSILRSSSPYVPDASIENDSMPSLAQECDAVEKYVRNIKIDTFSAGTRTCQISVHLNAQDLGNNARGTRTVILKLRVVFPLHYPFGAAPNFEYLSGSNMPLQLKKKVKECLTAKAMSCVIENKPCLHACMEVLVDMLTKSFSQLSDSELADQGAAGLSPVVVDLKTGLNLLPSTDTVHSSFPNETRPGDEGDSDSLESSASTTVSASHETIPAPPTCFAQFSPTGELVMVMSAVQRPSPDANEDSTSFPRTYEQFKQWLAPPPIISPQHPDVEELGNNDHDEDPSEYFSTVFQTKKRESGGIQYHNSFSTTTFLTTSPTTTDQTMRPHDSQVFLYDLSNCQQISKQLAERYIVDGPGGELQICEHNSAAASSLAHELLQHLQQSQPHEFTPIHDDMQMIINHFNQVATIWKIIGLISDPRLCFDSSEGSPWAQNPFARETIQLTLDYLLRVRDVQTLSVLACVLASPYRRYVSSIVQKSPVSSNSNCQGDAVVLPDEFCLLNGAMLHSMDRFRLFYAEILNHWGLKFKRAEIIKFVSPSVSGLLNDELKLNIEISAPQSGRETGPSRKAGDSSAKLRKLPISCEICHLPVQGLSTVCVMCGHGGHINHMVEWFFVLGNETCPSGCSCPCLRHLQRPIVPNILGPVDLAQTTNSGSRSVIRSSSTMAPAPSIRQSRSNLNFTRYSDHDSTDPILNFTPPLQTSNYHTIAGSTTQRYPLLSNIWPNHK